MVPIRIRRLSIAMLLLLSTVSRSTAEEDRGAPANQWIPLHQVDTLKGADLPEPEPLEHSNFEDAGSASLWQEPSGAPVVIDSTGTESSSEEEEDRGIPGRPYNGSGWYSRPEWESSNWRTGSGHRFGEFALESVRADPIEGWEGLSFTSGHGIHFLGGPIVSDMPPRLFDFNWGLHWFGQPTDRWWLDLAFSGGLYTDFEDSVREGWRFPAHAVSTWEMSEEIQPVLGIRYFDRDNLGLFPVAGVIFRPEERFRMELLFPEPRVAWRVAADEEQESWLSIAGRIGGGEWAIERQATGLADVATYNDYQLVLSLDTIDNHQSINSLEFGYIFERDLEYRSGAGNTSLPETFFIRMVNRK